MNKPIFLYRNFCVCFLESKIYLIQIYIYIYAYINLYIIERLFSNKNKAYLFHCYLKISF